MGNLLERYAKLTSTVRSNNGTSHTVVVSDGKNDIMWLEMYVKSQYKTLHSDERDSVLNVPQVNFDDSTFFALSESEQDTCALVLFKAFLKYYEANYGKNSGDWLPVSASFANYKLQEKFKKAVDKGIFPPESLEISNFTSEEDYEADPGNNMNNRRLNHEIELNPIEFLDKYNTQHLPTEGTAFVNVPVSQVKQVYDQLYTPGLMTNNGLLVNFIPNQINLTFDFLPDEHNVDAWYDLEYNNLKLRMTTESFFDFTEQDKDLFLTIFDNLRGIYAVNGDYIAGLEEIKTARVHRRLVRRWTTY